MTALPQVERWISPEEYLEGEKLAAVRHDYLAGTVHAMAGTTRRHNEIAGNIFASLHAQLRGKPCQTYMADVKVRVDVANDTYFYYPDVMVGCDPADSHRLYLERPRVIFEVLSPGTERIDRREKFFLFQRIESLDYYVLVDPATKSVKAHRRAEDWAAEILTASSVLALDSIGCELSLDTIFEGNEPDEEPA